MTYQPGYDNMEAFDRLPPIVRRALREAIEPPREGHVLAALTKTRDPHGVAGMIRVIDARIIGQQQFRIDEALSEEHRA